MDDESSIETPTDLEKKCILREIREKKLMDQVVNNNTVSSMEEQLHLLFKVANDVNDATTKEMKKSSQEGFVEVRTKLDYVYNIVLQRVPESTAA